MSDFKYSPYKLRDFHLAHPNLFGLLYKLDSWIKCWKEGLDNYNNLDDNKAFGQSLRVGFFKREGNITVLKRVTCYIAVFKTICRFLGNLPKSTKFCHILLVLLIELTN